MTGRPLSSLRGIAESAAECDMTNRLEDARYKDALRDIVYELIDHATHDPACHEFGYRSAMLYVLGLLKFQARAFELDEEFLCLADFDPERWYVQ